MIWEQYENMDGRYGDMDGDGVGGYEDLDGSL